jgi:small subunit ribosomal protein S17
MAKILQGKVVSNKMTGTIIVEVERLIPHPLFKKLLRRGRRFKVATNGRKVEIGAIVKIVETRPVAKDKHFTIHSSESASAPVTPKVLPVGKKEAVVKTNQSKKTKKASTKKEKKI